MILSSSKDYSGWASPYQASPLREGPDVRDGRSQRDLKQKRSCLIGLDKTAMFWRRSRDRGGLQPLGIGGPSLTTARKWILPKTSELGRGPPASEETTALAAT